MKPQIVNSLPVACFAPPLDDAKLARYRAAIEALPADSEVRDACAQLLACVDKWWALPESKRPDVERWLMDRVVGRTAEGKAVVKPTTVVLQPLDDGIAKALWDVTPWMRELDLLSTPRDDGLFDKLPPGDLCDAAFHLLWFCKELTLDREPMTQERLT